MRPGLESHEGAEGTGLGLIVWRMGQQYHRRGCWEGPMGSWLSAASQTSA